jgi:uncharacterized membrane protein
VKKLLALLIGVISLTYPFIVYFGLQKFSPALFAILIFLLALLKYFSSKHRQGVNALAVLAIAVIYSLALALSNSELLLRLYPVMISLVIASIFALSLRDKEAFITQLARISGKEITPRAAIYTRKLTMLWAALLLINAAIALYLALTASLERWMLYCGLISYLIFGTVMLLELAYRQFYIARYGR